MMDWEEARREAVARFRSKTIEERARLLGAADEALALYRETGDARLADYHIAFSYLQRRLGRVPTEAEVERELARM